ncbi:MAG TPA: carboxypeptidase-like regulatory domain-containing protein [Chthonomonadaceae bacterium]|nr:carboxypeptidase-like regulatory domain-containing protein [Chthonomonadaceae bacterium]
MAAAPTNRAVWLCLAATAVLLLGGCGGAGQNLTGGSVPVGGRAITGSAVLPDGSRVVGARVTVRSLPSGAVLHTATTDSSGHFTCSRIPTDADISIVVAAPPTSTMEAVVPQAELAANPVQPLDVGAVTALTTVVAAAIHLERRPAPEDTGGIVANQKPRLDIEAQDAHYSLAMQDQFIRDANSLNAEALTLIVPTANTELAGFAAQPSNDTAAAALNGLLGYLRAAHMRDLHIDSDSRSALIARQLAGTVYSPEVIVGALRTAKVANVTSVQISSASQRERTELTAFSGLGTGITPFEALVIAADLRTNGGLELDQRSLNDFLAQLLSQ